MVDDNRPFNYQQIEQLQEEQEITDENQDQESDFSEYSQRLNTPQRLILLDKLGVIELIENKMKKTGGWSKNKIAAIVAEIIGEKQSNIQSKLNPIGNPNVKQHNNPYSTDGNKEKVQDFLRKNNILKHPRIPCVIFN